MIYFDHNATTPLDERVLEAMLPYLSRFYANPSALYKSGRLVRSAVDRAREQLAALVDASPSQIVFTSGGTEANNLAINSLSANNMLAVSAIEHPSIKQPAQLPVRHCISIPVDSQGMLDLYALQELFLQAQKPELVSVMMANNETGVVQDIEAIIEIVKSHQAIMHSDAVQALGKIPCSFSRSGLNLMSVSSHKIYGPKGCGALIFDKKIKLNPVLVGGGQENGWRSGTENVAAIIGFGKAAELALSEMDVRRQTMLSLRSKLEQGLKTIPGLVIFSDQVERLSNTVQFGLPGMDGEMLLMQLDQKNIAVSSGSACTAGGGQASSVLTAMGVESELAKSAIRISLGQQNSEAEIEQLIVQLKSLLIKQ